MPFAHRSLLCLCFMLSLVCCLVDAVVFLAQWCATCYKLLTEPVEVDGREIPLSSIKKQKNDDAVEEGWVLCAGCNKWQHQICALFNQRRHDQSPSRHYFCPRCLLHELKTAPNRGIRIVQSRMKRAYDLDQARLCRVHGTCCATTPC
jgi:hypothetical protein